MTATTINDLPATATCSAASYAEEHLTMHQFMYETTAADPTSRGFLTPEHDHNQGSDLDSATSRVQPRVRIRTYP